MLKRNLAMYLHPQFSQKQFKKKLDLNIPIVHAAH
jgi:hypothetical protein